MFNLVKNGVTLSKSVPPKPYATIFTIASIRILHFPEFNSSSVLAFVNVFNITSSCSFVPPYATIGMTFNPSDSSLDIMA